MLDDINDLIERCVNKEERAWSDFINKFSGLVYYSARERLRRNGFSFSEQDIQDITQDVFIDIWEKSRLREVRERRKIKAWISIMGQTRALNYMRKKKERLLREEELFKVENVISDTKGGYGVELAEELTKAIEGFPAKEKIILKLNILYGKKHREIAEFMNIPINTVSTIISRKKETLKTLLKPN